MSEMSEMSEALEKVEKILHTVQKHVAEMRKNTTDPNILEMLDEIDEIMKKKTKDP